MNITEDDIITYPEPSDKEFAKKIYLKKEFNKNKYNKPIIENKSYEEISNEMCNNKSDFQLTNNQIFLKHFLSPNTPYNSILLYHGVGVGKTCAAINITEQFFNIYSKKCLILMPANLKENFKKQLFDINNLNQCTSEKYLKMVTDRAKLKKETIEKKINKIINSRYEFMGFLEFAKMVKEYEEKFISQYKIKGREKYIAFIKKKFSNRVIIIDEVHNARAEKDDTDKKIPNVLIDVLSNAINTKLILLTATPMFNGVSEIIWILNYMLANDKVKLLEVNKCFDANNVITQEGIDMITSAVRGRVSYMRGENPFTFPFKLYPSEVGNGNNYLKKTEIPIKDIYNKKLDSSLQISKSFAKTLYVSKMSKYQTSIYKEFSNQNVDNDDINEEDVDEENSEKYNISTMIQVSNIVYPSKNKSLNVYGKKGFLNNFDYNGGIGWKFKVSYKKDTNEFLGPELLKKYSAKLNDIVDCILNSEGIVYVYSYYLYSALLPLAIALEHRGFKRSNGSTILEKDNKTNTNLYYSLLTKDSQLKTDIQSEIEKITSTENINGEKVKVILGTSVTAEGINFKRIRQIHIVEPWFHLNKLEQITGRAIRMCSHIDLPPDKRNVTIYRHAALPEDTSDKKECTDLRIYRIAENKQIYINKIEKILIENSIDCNLNHPIISFPATKKIKIKTSQKVTILGFSVGDREDDKHTGLKCSNIILKNEENNIEENTFNKSFFIDDIDRYIVILKKYFSSVPINNYNNIYNDLSNQYNIDEDILKFTLEEMINKKTVITYKNEDGFIIYIGKLYMFQPHQIQTTRILVNDRKNNTMMKQNILIIDSSNLDLNNKSDIDYAKKTKTTNKMLIQIAKKVEEMKIYEPQIPKSIIYDYIIDRLSYDEFNDLMYDLVSLSDNITNEEQINLIINSLENAGIFVKFEENIYYALNIYNKKDNDIYIANFATKKYTKGNSIDHANFIKLTSNKKNSLKNSLKGYIDYTKTNIPQFKIVAENIKSNGTVCGTGSTKHEAYIEMVKSMDKTILKKFNKITNKNLCVLIELLMRGSKGVFGRPYTTLQKIE